MCNMYNLQISKIEQCFNYMHAKFQVAGFQNKRDIRHRFLDFVCLFLLGHLPIQVNIGGFLPFLSVWSEWVKFYLGRYRYIRDTGVLEGCWDWTSEKFKGRGSCRPLVHAGSKSLPLAAESVHVCVDFGAWGYCEGQIVWTKIFNSFLIIEVAKKIIFSFFQQYLWDSASCNNCGYPYDNNQLFF